MPDSSQLVDEFRAFARYLGWTGPIDRLAASYVRLHQYAPEGSSPIDPLLMRIASGGWFCVTLADAYGRLAAPHGTLRRRLVLVLAILESASVSHAEYDAANAAPPLETWLRLVVIGVRWALTTLLAVILIGPLHAVISAGSPRRRG